MKGGAEGGAGLAARRSSEAPRDDRGTRPFGADEGPEPCEADRSALPPPREGSACEGGRDRDAAGAAAEGCQYLFGDPKGAWRACGRPVARRSYCAEHYERCYLRPGTAAHRAALAEIRACVDLIRRWDGAPERGAPPAGGAEPR